MENVVQMNTRNTKDKHHNILKQGFAQMGAHTHNQGQTEWSRHAAQLINLTQQKICISMSQPAGHSCAHACPEILFLKL